MLRLSLLTVLVWRLVIAELRFRLLHFDRSIKFNHFKFWKEVAGRWTIVEQSSLELLLNERLSLSCKLEFLSRIFSKYSPTTFLLAPSLAPCALAVLLSSASPKNWSISFLLYLYIVLYSCAFVIGFALSKYACFDPECKFGPSSGWLFIRLLLRVSVFSYVRRGDVARSKSSVWSWLSSRSL